MRVYMWAMWAMWVHPHEPAYVMWVDLRVCGSLRRRLAQQAGGVARAACISRFVGCIVQVWLGPKLPIQSHPMPTMCGSSHLTYMYCV